MAQNVAKIDFQPGVQKDRSPLAAEPGWVNSQWIRFRGIKPESMGGYVAFTGTPDIGAAVLASHQWVDLSGNKWHAYATATKLYVVDQSGNKTDITPETVTGATWDSAVVSQVNGSTVYTVTVAVYETVTITNSKGTYTENVLVSGHGLATGDSVFLSWLNDTEVVTVLSQTQFTYIASAAGSTTTTTYDTPFYNANTADPFVGSDAWSLDNWGESLVAVPRGLGLYQWFPGTDTSELVADGDFDSAANWVSGTGWAITTGSPGYAEFTGAGTGSLDQIVAANLEPGEIYNIAFELATASTGFSVSFDAYSTASATITTITPTASGATTYTSYSMYVSMPANASTTVPFNTIKIRQAAGGSVTYRIRNISVNKVSLATLVQTAPRQSEAMFVDPNRFVVLLGTVEFSGVYNPLLVRWCNQEDITDWTPASDNLSGELPLSTGVKLVGGVATRGQNFIATESDVHAMQYTGDPGTVFVFQPLASQCGLVTRRAMIKDSNGAVYWWSNAGQFFRFGGGAIEAIPCTLLRDTMENVTTTLYIKIHAGLNSAFQEIFWFYPDTRDSATDVTRYVKFNYATGVWDSGAFVCTAWQPQGIFPYPVAVDGDGDIFFMENGNDANGGTLTTSITSSYFDIEDGGNLTLIERIIPDFDDQQGDVIFNFNLKAYPNASATSSGPHTATTTTEKIDTIFTARQAQVVISSAADPTFWRMGAIRFDIRKSGSRR